MTDEPPVWWAELLPWIHAELAVEDAFGPAPPTAEELTACLRGE